MKVRLMPLFLMFVSCGCGVKKMTIHQSDASYNEAIGADSQANEEEQNDTTEFVTPKEGIIYWRNPSFEENELGMHSTVPNQWKTYAAYESPPDLHTNEVRHFGVTQYASDGDKFVGMVVRDNDTYERLVQELDGYLEKGEVYQFQIDLSLSSRLISLSTTTLKEENFNKPAILRVWGGTSSYDEKELLYETMAVNHTGWKRYTIEFIPGSNCDFLILEAFYDNQGFVFPYNGNLMLDNLSPIRKVR
jgi:hypothetical protein